MAEALRPCPMCGVDLEPGHKSGLTTYQCPADHGVGINLLEAYGHFQHDELEAIWAGTNEGPVSQLRSPLSGRPMVEVTFLADDDDIVGNAGPNAQKVTIEVDPDNYFGWFSFAELRAMPTDTDHRGPSGPGLVGLSQIDRGASAYNPFFDSLKPEDYDSDEDLQTRDSGRGLNGLLGGIARRLRS